VLDRVWFRRPSRRNGLTDANMPRVVWISSGYRAYREAFLIALSSELRKRGFKLIVFVNSTPVPTAQSDEGPPPKSVHTLPAIRLNFGDRSIKLALPPLQAFSAVVVIVPENVGNLSSWLIVLFRRAFGRTTLVIGHGRDRRNSERTYRDRLRSWLGLVAGWWLAYNADSRRDVVGSIGLAPERVFVINNTVDVGPLLKAAVDYPREKPLEDLTCVFVGSLYTAKRVPLIVEAVSMARSRTGLAIGLDIVGDGEEMQTLVELSSDNSWLRLHGSMSGSSRGRIWSTADVALLPSSAGLAVVEAMSFALPIVVDVSFSHGPEVSYLQDEMSGLVRDLGGTAEGLAGAIIGLAHDPEYRSRLGAAALEAAALLTVDSSAEQFADGIEAALRAGGRTKNATADAARCYPGDSQRTAASATDAHGCSGERPN
jgi:L-malate glycosyltransferase